MNQPWKVIIVLLGIFIAGGVTGGFVALRFAKNRIQNRPVPEEWAPRHLKRLADRLELTPEQQEQIRPIVRHNMEQLSRVRNNSMVETKTILEGMQREISEKLTPEQRAKFEQMNREFREGREKFERERRRNPERPNGEKPPGDRPSGDMPAPSKPPGN
jgi:Spy/CpxP family protein refolding chaperone